VLVASGSSGGIGVLAQPIPVRCSLMRSREYGCQLEASTARSLTGPRGGPSLAPGTGVSVSAARPGSRTRRTARRRARSRVCSCSARCRRTYHRRCRRCWSPRAR